MRKMKIEEKAINIIIKKKKRLGYHDQTLMNNYFKKFKYSSLTFFVIT